MSDDPKTRDSQSNEFFYWKNGRKCDSALFENDDEEFGSDQEIHALIDALNGGTGHGASSDRPDRNHLQETDIDCQSEQLPDGEKPAQTQRPG